MDRPFRGRSRGIEIRLGEEERRLLGQLLGQLDELLDDGTGDPADPADPLAALVGLEASPAGEISLGDQDDRSARGAGLPDDPAVARLLPDGSRDDARAAAEFRRLTESGLRARKRRRARRAAEVLGDPSASMLGADDAVGLLTALTDLRLVLSERLGLRTDEDADLLHRTLARRLSEGAPQDAWSATAAIYDLLTWWQESLVAALSSRPFRRSTTAPSS
jgi:hypothetical protein